LELDPEMRFYDNVTMERKRRGGRTPRRFLVQALVPRDVYDWVTSMAEREGLSTSSWLRRLVMMQRAQQPPKARATAR
jgi:hypothetical protein